MLFRSINTVDTSRLRHPKEQGYFIVCAVLGGIFWVVLLVATIGTILLWLLFIALGLWIGQRLFKARVYGNAVKISDDQYGKLNEIVKQQCTRLGIDTPDVFIINGQGVINAFAIRFLVGKYVLLFSDLIDLMLMRDQVNELTMVIGHELGHHAAGHVNPWKNLLIVPARFIPFLGAAYGRSCELTADRIGTVVAQDEEASKRALISIVSGSRALASDVNIERFREQEYQVPPFFGFLQEIYSSHPRMTKRIIELEAFARSMPSI